jgi:DNA polymerase-1
MRYLVTNQKEIFPNETYDPISPEEALKRLSLKDMYGLDCETTGFDPYSKQLYTVQIGDEHNQFCIDCNTVDIKLFKAFLEYPYREFVLHNAKFDLRFFYHHRINVSKVYDTYLAERLLYLGFPPGIHKMDLASLCNKYLGVHLDKSVRGALHYEGLSDRVVKYGCEDVRYLLQLRKKQLEEISENGLSRAIGIESQFTKVLAYIEYSGLKLDVNKWKDKMLKDQARLQEAKDTLNEWVINHGNRKFYEEVNDLFEGRYSRCKINWNSSKQVVPLLESLGFDLLVKDKQTGKMKKSVDANIINLQKNKSDIAKPYLEYSKAFKTVSTYGENFINQINPVSGRLHTQFNQLMDTSRLSCGGKDKDTGQENINFQF